MKRRGVVIGLALSLLFSTPALAWDPGRGEITPPAATPPPDPAPYLAPPPDLYYVTDTYVSDVVTTNGALTTYSTTTAHESTGSYARVLDSVATGRSSVFDGDAFNGRAALTDGRAVAGTYYENYVLTPGGFVPVSIVFFQDDAETRRLALATPTPHVAPSVMPTSTVRTTAAPVVSAPATCCHSGGNASPTPAPRPTPTPITPGISLSPLGAPLTRVEVLRGRAVALWPRALSGGVDAPVRTWALVSGEPGNADATSGVGGTPFVTAWDRLAAPGTSYDLAFRLVIAAPGGDRETVATIAVLVRAPALED
jgi:hypothetical protein